MSVDAGVVDLILLLVALEACALLAWSALRRGPAPADFAFNLAAGAALMVALRVALAGAEPRWIGAALAVALVAHVADLWRRLAPARGRAAPAP